ncbi:MAG: undecaprenyldiphospho-muramoylpentapeptide beta-N-acetylglucosaminyltransferase [Chitinispirillaceae bacterium]|nr:undecaprenyldiphospho-muramoylpentapeptide beta-N-acetylglucosaminyltransferase [Chitinispirillaceae bacterium]
MKKILLTGGGTAGHVTPNIALLPRLRELGFEIFYAGTRLGIEDLLMTREGVPFHAISAGKLRRYFDIRNLTDLFRIGAGFFQSILLLIRLRPDVVFSKGGFVACPIVWAAWLLRIPAIIHESDITPGLANRLSAPFAKKICYSFHETARYLTKHKAVRTGLPVRETLRAGNAAEGKRLCEFSDSKPVVLMMGGSQGSKVINIALREALPNLLPEFNVCHICGKGNLGERQCGYRQFEYVTDDLPHLFAMADVFVGRSGATTLFELLALKKPGLLIPLATGASRGDQIINARSFERHNYGAVLRQEELTPATLAAGIKKVYANRRIMIDAMEKSRIPYGVAAVIGVIQETVGSGKKHG